MDLCFVVICLIFFAILPFGRKMKIAKFLFLHHLNLAISKIR